MLPSPVSLLALRILFHPGFKPGSDGGFLAAGDGHPGPAPHPELACRQLLCRRQVDHIGAVGLQKAVVRQQGLCHLRKGHPEGEGGHVLPGGKMEMHHMVGTLQILDVRKGQRPQARRRGHRDDRAVLRLSGTVQQGGELLRAERQQQVLHGVHPVGIVGVGGRVGKKGQRGPRAVPPQGIGGFQARRGVARRQLHKVELVPGTLGVPGQQGVHPGQLLHDAGIRPAGIICFLTLQTTYTNGERRLAVTPCNSRLLVKNHALHYNISKR